ncbi:MAG TPA: hypothetical protein VNL91_05390 [Thermoanaerobaculia bacterium]|nr:hypothetical protein [Thermoanaerobaculia bacterium]
MKATYAVTLLLSATLPLVAAEPQKEAAQGSAQEPKTDVAQLSPAPEKAIESPLVAAARRANRLGKKPAFVITNATVAQSAAADAHVTTTTTSRSVQVPPPAPSREAQMAANQALDRKAVERAAAEKKKEEAQKANSRPPYDDAESLYGDPNRPDAVEPPPPQPQPSKKP